MKAETRTKWKQWKIIYIYMLHCMFIKEKPDSLLDLSKKWFIIEKLKGDLCKWFDEKLSAWYDAWKSKVKIY